MAQQQHDKFVLKEKQRLQAKEKELEKREAEMATMAQQNAAMEAELKAKSAQLSQTAELLRKTREEADDIKRKSEAREDEHAKAGTSEATMAQQLEHAQQQAVRLNMAVANAEQRVCSKTAPACKEWTAIVAVASARACMWPPW